MINQNSQLYKDWLVLQATNPPKVKTKLEVRTKHKELVGRCCLGNACSLDKTLETKLTSDSDSLKLLILYINDNCCSLPASISKKLNITREGEFTREGAEFVIAFLKEHNVDGTELVMYLEGDYLALININDSTDADHATIGKLIEYLAKIERKENIECFKPFRS